MIINNQSQVLTNMSIKSQLTDWVQCTSSQCSKWGKEETMWLFFKFHTQSSILSFAWKFLLKTTYFLQYGLMYMVTVGKAAKYVNTIFNCSQTVYLKATYRLSTSSCEAGGESNKIYDHWQPNLSQSWVLTNMTIQRQLTDWVQCSSSQCSKWGE